MIDRDTRDRMAVVVEDYLGEKISAFAFDDQLTELSAKTKDETVKRIAHELWFHYDDCKDHKVVLSGAQWDYFQRLVLILKSDASVRVERRRTWSWRQLVAAMLLVCFAAVLASLGWGLHLLVVSVPFGLASMVLSRCGRTMPVDQTNHLIRLVPFASLNQILAVRRTTTGFKKSPYPPALIDRRIRSPFMDRVLAWQWRVMWLLFSPIALLGQCFPDTEQRIEVAVD